MARQTAALALLALIACAAVAPAFAAESVPIPGMLLLHLFYMVFT